MPKQEKRQPAAGRHCEECGAPLHLCIHHKASTSNALNPSWPATVHEECGVLQDPTLPPTDQKKYSPYPELLSRVLRSADKQCYSEKGREMLISEVHRLKAQNLPDRAIIARAFQRVDHQWQQDTFINPEVEKNVG